MVRADPYLLQGERPTPTHAACELAGPRHIMANPSPAPGPWEVDGLEEDLSADDAGPDAAPTTERAAAAATGRGSPKGRAHSLPRQQGGRVQGGGQQQPNLLRPLLKVPQTDPLVSFAALPHSSPSSPSSPGYAQVSQLRPVCP